MRKNCDTCKHDEFSERYCDGCHYGNPPSKWEPADFYKPDTNGERIRNMTDKELAASNYIPCPYDNDGYGECKFGWHEREQTCEECKLEWLKMLSKE